jgi:hypothetical protein
MTGISASFIPYKDYRARNITRKLLKKKAWIKAYLVLPSFFWAIITIASYGIELGDR